MKHQFFSLLQAERLSSSLKRFLRNILPLHTWYGHFSVSVCRGHLGLENRCKLGRVRNAMNEVFPQATTHDHLIRFIIMIIIIIIIIIIITSFTFLLFFNMNGL